MHDRSRDQQLRDRGSVRGAVTARDFLAIAKCEGRRLPVKKSPSLAAHVREEGVWGGRCSSLPQRSPKANLETSGRRGI